MSERTRKFWGLPEPDAETVAFYSEVKSFSDSVTGGLIDESMLRPVENGIREVSASEFSDGVRRAANVEIIGNSRRVSIHIDLLGKRLIRAEYYQEGDEITYGGISLKHGGRTMKGQEALVLAKQFYSPTASGQSLE